MIRVVWQTERFEGNAITIEVSIRVVSELEALMLDEPEWGDKP